MPRLYVQWFLPQFAKNRVLAVCGARGNVAACPRTAGGPTTLLSVIRGSAALFLLVFALAGCGGGGDDNGPGDSGGDDTQPVIGQSGDEEQPDQAPVLGF